MRQRLAGFVSLEGLPALPVEVARQVNDREAAVMFGPVEPVWRVDDRALPGPAGNLPVRIYRPSAAVGAPLLVYFHGGGWVVGGLDSHDGVARFLSVHGRCMVVAVGYRLAPEHRFPAALDDAWAATLWLQAHAGELGADPDSVAVGGDSAGGSLAAVVARRARDRRLDLALQLLVYPALDCSPGAPASGEVDYWLTQYLPQAKDRFHPDASPLRADELRGLPAAFLQSCELDPLKVQAEAYATRLRDSGVRAEHTSYPGLIHGAYRMPGVLPGARRMLEDSAAALVAAFGSA